MKKNAIGFVLGLIVGYEGVRLTTHLIYIAIIIVLLFNHIFHWI